MADSTRIQMLSDILKQNPNDAFARYGLAIELANSGDVENALAEFKSLLAAHPDYSAGHFMAAQALAKAGRKDEARDYLRQGITAAARTGNAHAQREMQAMLEELDF